ncbi:MAG: hypothetical protein PHG24_02135, partial [Candidatus Pacebacteria bacterium]|nr:hypothetical protein [Candidatus Paceibacterota bacterium]
YKDLPVIAFSTKGTKIALRSKAKTIVAIDSNPEVEAAFKNGEIVAVLVQDSSREGRIAVDMVSSGKKEDCLMKPMVLFK